MIAKLRRISKSVEDQIATAIYQEAQIEATEVKRRTPVDTGVLRSTVHVTDPERRGKSWRVTIVAGGPAAHYAVYVHENLEAFHKVGQAKFLESVLKESRPYMAARIARRIKLNKGA